MAIRCYIGFGANLGNPLTQLEEAQKHLREHPQIEILRRSHLYRSEPLAPNGDEQPWYLNCVLEIDTTLSLHKLFQELKNIEMMMGRSRRKKWASRLVDLDILFFGDVVFQDKELFVPHKEIQNRNFVLKPLCDLIPDMIHPDLNIPIQELLELSDDHLLVESINTALKNTSTENRTPSSHA